MHYRTLVPSYAEVKRSCSRLSNKTGMRYEMLVMSYAEVKRSCSRLSSKTGMRCSTLVSSYVKVGTLFCRPSRLIRKLGA